MEVTVTKDNFDELKNGDKPFVLDFWASWCGPCRMVGPVISQLSEEYDGRVVVGKCNVDDEEELAAEFGIRSIPTILFIKGGEVVEKHVGGASKGILEEKLKKLL